MRRCKFDVDSEQPFGETCYLPLLPWILRHQARSKRLLDDYE